jgi:hypothetical protein
MQIAMLSSVWPPELLTAAMLQQLRLLTAKDSFLVLLLRVVWGLKLTNNQAVIILELKTFANQ